VHSPSPSPPDNFVLYLDENLCNSRAILDTLTRLSVRHERHLDHFGRGTLDETWLPKVGLNGWVLLTTDKRIRYNFLEKRALEANAVREFVFASGNMSGQDMAVVLELALPKMRRLCRKLKPPFVASVTRTGEIHLRWPKD
jgi:PIN domain-containing protein